MILAILQARVSSSRLPGKVLKPILGMPMLLRQTERLQRVRKIDRLLVATSTESSDDAIQVLCDEHGIACVRGRLNDVLDRFYQASQAFRPDHIVRLTADCPLTDPVLIDEVIDFYLKGNFDYASNSVKATYPDGLDMEIFRFSCLESAWREADMPSQREHVTSFIYQHPQRFNLGQYESDVDLSHLRWTVDEPKDFELVSMIYEALYQENPNFSTQDILRLLDLHPEWAHWNTQHQRNEGYKKSLEADLLLTRNETKEN
jgi:spore coat polysaccharide biosynthesis protein SpsF